MAYRIALLNILVGLAWLVAIAPARAGEPSPEEILAQQGLRRLPQSTTWANKLEHEIRARLTDLPQHRDTIAAIEQSLNERIELNARQWAAAKQTESSLNISLASLATNDPARGELLKRRAQVLAQAIAPDKLNQQADVRGQLIELNNRRYALWTTLLAARREAPQVADSYRDLARNPQVQAALRSLGGNHRLGPGRNYGEELRKLGDIERAVLTDWLPLFNQGNKQRVTVLINETAPATFTWTASADPLVLTASMAQAAGLTIANDATRRELTLAKGRTYRAAQVNLPQLRVGRHLLKDVPALVLPPEGEDLGARLGSEALVGLHTYPQLERLRLLVEGSP